MAEDSVLPMREEFPRWYRTVDVSGNRERLEARWKGVSSLAQATDPKSVETMLSLLLRTRSRPDSESMASLRAHFKAADDLFDMSDNDRELEILCGATLATVLDGAGDAAGRAALATSVAFFSGARKADFPLDLAAAAEVAVARISDERRIRPNVSLLANIGRTGLDQETIDKIKQSFSHDTVIAAFQVMAKFSNGMMDDVVRKANAAIGEIEDFIAIQDEELQLLWWLFGGRSKTMDRPFGKVPANAQPMVLAAEIAEATQFLPGPDSVKPILSRARLKEREKTTAAAAINACEEVLLRKWLENLKPSPVTQPLHFAIHRKLEAGDDASWVQATSASQGSSSATCSIANVWACSSGARLGRNARNSLLQSGLQGAARR
jgi:GTPase-associated system helical domain